MKKITALVLTLLCVATMLFGGIQASATQMQSQVANQSTTVEFNADYTELYFKGKTYIRFVNSSIYVDGEYVPYDITLSPNQKSLFSEISLNVENDVICHASITFTDGLYMSAEYIEKEYYELYKSFKREEVKNVTVNFDSVDENFVNTTMELIADASALTTVKGNHIYDNFTVFAPMKDDSLGIYIGEIIIDKDNTYYYADYALNGLSTDDYIYDLKSVKAYKITDKKLLEKLEKAKERYYGTDFGFFEDDNLSKTISDIFLTLLFGVLPFGIFVLFLILGLRSKTNYRKFFLTVAVLALATLLVFAGTAAVLEIFKNTATIMIK